jgi:hypothetical protein
VRITRARLLPPTTRRSGRVALRATRFTDALARLDPRRDALTIQLRAQDTVLACATVPTDAWRRKGGRLAFDDVPGRLAHGTLRTGRNGSLTLRVAVPSATASRLAQGSAALTLGAGGQCAAGSATLQGRVRR